MKHLNYFSMLWWKWANGLDSQFGHLQVTDKTKAAEQIGCIQHSEVSLLLMCANSTTIWTEKFIYKRSLIRWFHDINAPHNVVHEKSFFKNSKHSKKDQRSSAKFQEQREKFQTNDSIKSEQTQIQKKTTDKYR